MADLAIGLSKKVVDGLVKKVEGAIKEEQELWRIVERDSVFIKDEFEMMKSFLNTADTDRVRNSVVRTWVRQVRDLSYDAEDCMDDVLDLEPKRPWWTLPFLRHMLKPCCRPRQGRALDEAVDKIKLIKARVEEVSHRNLRYNLINTTGSQQMQQAATAMDMSKVQEGSRRLRCLLDYVACHGRMSVISVWGTGGNLDTMSIIRNAFDQTKVYQVHKCRAWAWVKLMHPFSPQKFLGDLVAQLLTNSGTTRGADLLSKMKDASSVDLAKEVEQLVKGQVYFLVLEDLSNMAEWDTIRTYLPDEKNGSGWVVVSTQHRQIAELCVGQPHYVQELSQLSEDHYVHAFLKKEIRMPSRQNQGSTYVASLSAAANYSYDLIGRDEEVRELHDLISSSERRPPDDTHVVTVSGPPNIGKDAVVFVSKVCSQLVLTPSFELYGWVDVPNYPFNVREFSQSLLSVLRPKSPDSTDPVGECSRLLSKHRCLVVINGLRCTEDYSELASAGLIHKHPNSCIVVVTTDESVDRYWTKAMPAVPLFRHQQHRLPAAGSMGGSSLSDIANSWQNHWLPGRYEELCRLRDMVSRGRNAAPSVVTVWGPAGVGKNILVAKVYSHYMLTSTDPPPFRLYGWVDMSHYNSNPLISIEAFFSRSLLSSYAKLPWWGHDIVYYDDPIGPETDNDTAIQQCLNLLSHTTSLVVIDGLQSMEDCSKLINARLIPTGSPDHCTILVTSEESVATFCKEKTPYAVCYVKPLYGQQQQGQVPTPRRTLDDITRLFHMANCCFQKYPPIIGRDPEVVRLSEMISPLAGQYQGSNQVIPSRNRNGIPTRVVVISGLPGVGKTVLVQEAYSRFVLNRFATHRPFVLYGWVQVSNPFNLMGFCRSLLSALRPQSPQSPDPIRDCSNLVRNHVCFIVIDGLQRKENFRELVIAGLIYGHPKSCIVLITTDQRGTASLVPEADALFRVKPLDRQPAKMLFKQVYGRGRPMSEELLDLVVNKSGGLPIVIIAVAKYLRRLSEHEVTQFTADVMDGKFIHELATKPEPEFAGLMGLLAWVDSELKACPLSLKLLFLYMLNFSQGTPVQRKRLVRRWIAEGYIENTGICDMVTEAEKRVQELQDLTMIMMQVARGGGHRGYQLSFFGEVLMSRAAEEDPLFLPLEVSALTEGKRSLTSRGCAGRHLRIDDNWKRNEFVFRSLDLSRLRSLTVCGGSFESYFINNSMKVLRVLDLEGADVTNDDDLKEIPKLLPGLRFLSMRGCSSIRCLPDSIGDLRQLQTLDIRRTRITKLPDSILKLRNMQCLRAGHTMKAWTLKESYTPASWGRRMSSRLLGLEPGSWQPPSYGVTIPRGFSSQLTALHTLGIVNVNNADGGAILEELQHLKQLRKVELYGINSYNMWGLRRLARGINSYNLDSLSLQFTEGSTRGIYGLEDALGYSYEHRRRRPVSFRLKLHGHVDILKVSMVTDLTLEIDTYLTEDNMKRIGELRMVRNLRLHFHRGSQEAAGFRLKFDAEMLTDLTFDDDDDDRVRDQKSFPKLEVLEISNALEELDNTWLDVEFASGPGAVGTLKVLKFVGSQIAPRGLRNLLSLEEVWIRGTPLEAIGEALEGHPNKITIIDFKSWAYLRDPRNVHGLPSSLYDEFHN